MSSLYGTFADSLCQVVFERSLRSNIITLASVCVPTHILSRFSQSRVSWIWYNDTFQAQNPRPAFDKEPKTIDQRSDLKPDFDDRKGAFKSIKNALDKVSALRGERFEWRPKEYEERNFSQGKRLGINTQEAEPTYPVVFWRYLLILGRSRLF